MSVEVHTLGTPLPAAQRGGDCRARDLDQERNVHGGHRFAATTDCRIDNGIVRLTVGATGVAPTLTVEAMTGYQSTGDVFNDVFDDLFPGSYTAKAWTELGTLTLYSSLLTAFLTGVRLVACTPESITIRLVSPVIRDACIRLDRGESMILIQHGSPRPPFVPTNRRISWAATGLTGASGTGIVTETAPLPSGFTRFVFGRDTVTSNAGAFSVTAVGSTSATFAAGVASGAAWDTAADLRGQFADSSRAAITVEQVA